MKDQALKIPNSALFNVEEVVKPKFGINLIFNMEEVLKPKFGIN